MAIYSIPNFILFRTNPKILFRAIYSIYGAGQR